MSAKQGQGPATEFKQRGLQAAIGVSASVSAKNDFPYWHADLNSGSGWNERARCIGSPLAFLGAIRKTQKLNFHAHFCDRNELCIWELESRLNELWIDPDNRCLCFGGDNRDLLPIMAARICERENPKYAMGSVLCDPNGWMGRGKKGEGVPYQELIEFCQTHPRIDLIVNLNVRTYRLGIPHKDGVWAIKFWPSIPEFPNLFSKKHWLIRSIIRGKGDEFVLLVGRNYRMGDHKALGFYHLDSQEGEWIVDRVEGRQTIAETQDLFETLPDLPPIPLASGFSDSAKPGLETIKRDL